MTDNQDLGEDEVLAWICEQVSDDLEELELTSATAERLDDGDLDLSDLLYALRHIRQIRRDYAGGCFTARGVDVDGKIVTAVVAPPSKKNRLKVIKVWRD